MAIVTLAAVVPDFDSGIGTLETQGFLALLLNFLQVSPPFSRLQGSLTRRRGESTILHRSKALQSLGLFS